jgi:hypothetical protein
MNRTHWRAIKTIFHISPPPNLGQKSSTFEKLEPLSRSLRRVFQKVILPSSYISVDEIIAKFTSQSPHILLIKGKPISKKYKILSLYNRGYVYNYLYTSRGGLPQISEKLVDIAIKDLTWSSSSAESTYFNDLSTTSKTII